MKSKMLVAAVRVFRDGNGDTTHENVILTAVPGDDATANLQLVVNNPAFFNDFKEGDVFGIELERVQAAEG